MPLWLIGMMGSGKSVVGRQIAVRTNKPFLDTDLIIEANAGRSVAEVFTDEGETGFRMRESNAIAAAASFDEAIVATGGGSVLLDANVASMRSSGPVIWLQARPDTLASRLQDVSNRPLLNDDGSQGIDIAARLALILEARWAAYEKAADHIVPTDDASVDEVARLIEEIWNAS